MPEPSRWLFFFLSVSVSSMWRDLPSIQSPSVPSVRHHSFRSFPFFPCGATRCGVPRNSLCPFRGILQAPLEGYDSNLFLKMLGINPHHSFSRNTGRAFSQMRDFSRNHAEFPKAWKTQCCAFETTRVCGVGVSSKFAIYNSSASSRRVGLLAVEPYRSYPPISSAY